MTPCFQGPGICPASSNWFYVAEKTKINRGFGGALALRVRQWLYEAAPGERVEGSVTETPQVISSMTAWQLCLAM